MKKILIITLTGLLLAACSDENNNSDVEENNQTTTDTSTDNEEASEEKKIYQIGETAVITSDMYDFDYEVTVDNFELTKEVDGIKIEEFLTGAREEHRFAVVDVTIKNISDESYVPHEMFSANFATEDQLGGEVSNDEFFTEGDKELQPDQEVKGRLVYTTRVDEADTFILKYEFTSDEETHFELPNPES
ncbi:hypothetical protein CIL05_13415 [Virgibacillus profundi]|uniref:DUF4352 domain-containing protein n=1 Tax=Virgibacillus profundi TaxID=2024555 RepID=A0A2A2ICH7_9BACI|nr:DUF4352 domain-containing protein [Virgibacillus profundi]PAV28974.1 hypothetical protein CIL05_13415 [Virgibacillus profundi]PXY53142.1 DUF4352 domain-containing protein [Virgibacillus profundi]